MAVDSVTVEVIVVLSVVSGVLVARTVLVMVVVTTVTRVTAGGVNVATTMVVVVGFCV